ncbi:hypothetical protein [Mucilaginibacter flavus]|uniref:hypothetical protein n=1 Tax=Mucilaginibacter flavus TaxID=931504 RepID=UPI0025B29E13|nr:hypothetical protein [Mucilaginibacter flavus]MDN3582765.1 hypothetical protein [Mucilaginibacter flavus]
MEQLQLYINDSLVDLSDDSPIALTFQINNLAEVKNQQGNTSNQFKLPLTQRNRQILGFPDDIAFTTNLPYQYYDARIIQDGLEIVPYGMAQLNTIEQDSASITVLSGNVDFFDALDVKIYDMGDSSTTVGKQNAFGPYQHNWNLATVTQSQLNTEGYIWPVVDYGKIATDYKNSPQIDARYQRPGFFLKTAIDLFAQTAGYKIDPDSFLLKQPLYDKLIVQFANDNFEHNVDYQTNQGDLGMQASLRDEARIDSPRKNATVNGVFNFKQTQSDIKNQFDGKTFTAANVFTGTVQVEVPKLYLQGGLHGDNTKVDIVIYLHTPDGDLSYRLTYEVEEGDPRAGSDYGSDMKVDHTFESRKLTQDIDFKPGYQVTVGFELSKWAPAYFTISGGTSLTITAKDNNILYNQDVQCERIFPDITQKDLLKDTLQRFGIICQSNNTTRMITLSSFRDIVNNIPVAYNWTQKCLDQGKTVAFQLGSYAQVNTLSYKADDAITDKKFGNSQININDKTMPLTAALVESQFAPTLNRPYIGGTIAQILKVDTANDDTAIDFSINTQPRILIDQKINLQNLEGKPSITFTDGGSTPVVVNDVVSVPYFYKPDADSGMSLLWDDLRKAYYPELEKILQQTKKVVRYFLLTPRDILELNLLIPVYLEQDSCYYYINKIDSWRKGQPTKVELVKLG